MKLNQADFDAWWKGKRDNAFPDRHRACPIARYLRHLGFKRAGVGLTIWRDGHRNRSLPGWAREYVSQFDMKYKARRKES